MRSARRVVPVALIVGLLPSLALAAPLDGRWEGTVHVAGQELHIAVTLSTTAQGAEATIDIPQQGVSAARMTNVRVDTVGVHFELPAGPGVAVFDGAYKDGAIAGTFRQAVFEGTFDLRRPAAAGEAPSPYGGEEVRVTSAEATLACTLTRPVGAGPFPAVYLLTGSGAQNRDEELFGFRPFRLIADDLTRRGLVVLRCDDRGVGGSTPPAPTATSQDSADDALAAIRFLRARPEVEAKKVGLLGHSIGGVEAALAAAKAHDLAFLVLLASPAVRGDVLVRTQLEAIARADGQSEAAIREALTQEELAFKVSRTGEGVDELSALLRAQVLKQIEGLPEAQRKAVGDPQQQAERGARQQVAILRTPWYRFMLDYDPASDLARLTCPILAIYGEKDLQVDAQANRKAFEAAVARTGHARARSLVIPGANHLFQAGAATGSPSEYPRLPKELAPGVLDAIGGFVVEATR